MYGSCFASLSKRRKTSLRTQPPPVGRDDEGQDPPPSRCLEARELIPGYRSPSHPLTLFDIPFLLCCLMQRLFFYDFPQSPPSPRPLSLPLSPPLLRLRRQPRPPLGAAPEAPHPLLRRQLPFLDRLRVVRRSSAMRRTTRRKSVAPDGDSGDPVPTRGHLHWVHFLHLAVDGRSFNHFTKSWASIHRSGGDSTGVDDPIPFYNREAIRDPNGLEPILSKDWWSCMGFSTSSSLSPSEALLAVADKMRATFVWGKAHIDGLKAQVLSQLKNSGGR